MLKSEPRLRILDADLRSMPEMHGLLDASAARPSGPDDGTDFVATGPETLAKARALTAKSGGRVLAVEVGVLDPLLRGEHLLQPPVSYRVRAVDEAPRSPDMKAFETADALLPALREEAEWCALHAAVPAPVPASGYALLVGAEPAADGRLRTVRPAPWSQLEGPQLEGVPEVHLMASRRPWGFVRRPFARRPRGIVVDDVRWLRTLLRNAGSVHVRGGVAPRVALLARLLGRPVVDGTDPSQDDVRTTFAALLAETRWLDPHTRRPTDALSAAHAAMFAARRRIVQRPVATVGLNRRRRAHLAPFLASAAGPPRHFAKMGQAERWEGRRGQPVSLAVWGADVPASTVARTLRIEDGFVRSVGLGARLVSPLSVVVERGSLHFDARGTSDLERHLRRPTTEPERVRAKALMERIRGARVTKYMEAASPADPLPETGRSRILVVGQVENDASIRYGAPGIRDNTALIGRVRELFPDAFIAYRDHPDVVSGLRPGRADARAADLLVDDHAITDLLGWCDRVETMTSLTGFEALLRGIPVGTHGWPFYAGWGLTDDRLDRPRRGEVDVVDLCVSVLLRYPRYIHPASLLPCTPERLVDALIALRDGTAEAAKVCG